VDTIHAQLKTKRGKTVAVEIPTDEEIERIAMRMHAAGKPCLETILGCKVSIALAKRSLTPLSVLTHSRASEVRSRHRDGRRFPQSSLSDMMDRGRLSCLGRQATTNHRHGSDTRISLSEHPNRRPESCCDAGRAA
jgi:hypothetical protein